MATKAISLQAATPQDLETMTMGYIARGFTIMNKTPAQVTLLKKKQFSTTWLIIDLVLIFLFGFGLLLLIIYLIMYAMGNDQMVTITVSSLAAQQYGGQLPQQQPITGQLAQQAVSGQLPQPWVNAPRSEDGNYWWDGQNWQPVPRADQSGPLSQSPTNPTAY